MDLLSWGANSHGQLGHGTVTEACVVPTKVLNLPCRPEDIKSIVGGGGHSLLLHRGGQVYAVGWNNSKQLGIESCQGDKILTFELLNELTSHHASHLACGWDSSLAITRDGGLFVWGSNSFSQLGVSKEFVYFAADSYSDLIFVQMLRTHKPILLPVSTPRHAAFGLRHLVVVDSCGSLYVCGSGNKGQLGLVDSEGRPIHEVNSLTKVPGVEGVVRTACGQHHTVALTNCGHVLVWGDNKFGQLGLDPTLHPIMPIPHRLECCHDVVDVFSGWTFTLVMSENGIVTVWGRNNYGQLGVRSSVTHRPVQLTSLERVKQISVGSEHCVAMLEMGRLVSWGWNEHGNCGNGSQENVLEPTSVVLPRGRAVLVGGGACHNFVVVDADNFTL